MNHSGRASGFALILILAAALIVALLVARQFTSINRTEKETPQPAQAVEQARDAVEQLNDRLRQYDN